MKKLFILLAAGSLLAVAPSCDESGNTDEAAVTDSSPVASSATTSNESSVLPERNPTVPRPPKYQAEAESMESTTVEFAGEVYDFGEVPEGTKVTHQFSFTNSGENPLKLTRVKASCGCTTPSFSKEPIAPGATGFIDVEFDSSGKPGFQNKSVTVTGNFSDGVNKILRIKGQVKPATE